MTESNDNDIDFSLLLASSIHDIKNSLGMLLNSMEEIISPDEIKNEKQKKHYATLRSEASRINNSLIYLLGLYHLDKQQLSVTADEVFVHDFLEEQIASQELLFSINNISIELDCDEQLTAFFDENLIAGIINNILVNNVRYTRDKISLHAYMQDDFLRIDISDNGSGYPQHLLENCNIDKKNIDFISGSTHLGLYFADEISKLHRCHEKQGSIQLSNLANGGGCFSLLLP